MVEFQGGIQTKSGVVAQPPIYHLSGEKLSRVGIFLMDTGHVSFLFFQAVFLFDCFYI